MLMMPPATVTKPRNGFPAGMYMALGSLIIFVGLLGLASALALFIGYPGMMMFGYTYMYLIPLAVGFGLWEIVTGLLALIAACSSAAHRQMGLKAGFTMMCITTLMVSILFSFYFMMMAMNSMYMDMGMGYMIPMWLIAVASVMQSLLTMVGACVGCCCTPTKHDGA